MYCEIAVMDYSLGEIRIFKLDNFPDDCVKWLEENDSLWREKDCYYMTKTGSITIKHEGRT